MKEGPNPKKARSRFVCYSSFVIRIASLYRLGPRFLIEHSHSLRIGGPGFFMGIANGGQPRSPELTQRAHHVEHHAGLPRLIEVQIVPHHNIEKIVGRQNAIKRRLDVIAGDIFRPMLSSRRHCYAKFAQLFSRLSYPGLRRNASLRCATASSLRPSCASMRPRLQWASG